MVLLIVDDEKNIRDGLAQHIPWDNLGITTVITAKNGIDALSKMQDNPPDILLSDVRMPKMNGIELAKHVKGLYPDCQVIFLSGYADKEYLLSAIEVKANKYIEKPIDREDIYETVKASSAIVHALTSEKDLKKRLENNLRQHTIYEMEPLLLELLSSASDTIDIMPHLKTLGLSTTQTYCVAYCKLHWPIESNPLNIKRRLFNEALLNKTGIRCAFNAQHHLILLLPQPINTQLETTFFAPFIERLTARYDFAFSIGISRTFKKPRHINLAYSQAKAASNLGFFKELNQYYVYTSHLKENSLCLPSTNAFQRELLKGKAHDALHIFRQLRLTLNDPGFDEADIRNLYIQILVFIFDAADVHGITLSQNKNVVLKQLPYLYSHHLIYQCIHTTLTDYFDVLREKKDIGGRAYEIMVYIQNNIHDDQLSVSRIAEEFGLSQAYLCSTFKKKTNKTINNYITEIRIKKAKELLWASHIKVYEVSRAIGITDTNYFSVFFKKHTGLSPLDYRESL